MSDNNIFERTNFIGLSKLGIDWKSIIYGDSSLQEMYDKYVEAKQKHYFINADYSALEVYYLAAASKDPNLIAAVNAGKDLHSLNAQNIFKTAPYEDLFRRAKLAPDDPVIQAELSHFKTLRKSAKSLTFSILYGAGLAKIASDLRISPQEAQKLIDSFYGVYPKVREWQRNQIAAAISKGYIEDGFGRRRAVSAIYNNPDAYKAFVDEDFNTIRRLKKEGLFWGLRSEIKQVGNTPIQSAASLMCSKAFAIIHDKWKDKTDARALWWVHDAITFWTHENSAIDNITSVRSIMENDVKLPGDPVKYRTSLDIGYNYEFMTECDLPSSSPLTLDYIKEAALKALMSDVNRKFKLLVKSTGTILSDSYVGEVLDAKQAYYDELVSKMGIEGITNFDDYMSWANGMSREEWFAALEEDAKNVQRGTSWEAGEDD